MFPYLGSWLLHPPRRLSVLQKRVISTDGKLLKCPEGSSSSVLLKTGRSVHYLTHRCLEGSKLPSGFQFYFAWTDVLGYILEVSTPYGVQVFKTGKCVPGARGWSRTVGTRAPLVLPDWRSEPLLSLGCCYWLFALVTGSLLFCSAEFFLDSVSGSNTSLLLNHKAPCSVSASLSLWQQQVHAGDDHMLQAFC